MTFEPMYVFSADSYELCEERLLELLRYVPLESESEFIVGNTFAACLFSSMTSTSGRVLQVTGCLVFDEVGAEGRCMFEPPNEYGSLKELFSSIAREGRLNNYGSISN